MNFSLVAHEAMHNVITLASTCITDTDRGYSFQKSCFEPLLLHGFWKKLIYLLDIDSRLQLCMAFGDDEGYRLNYLVEKLGVNDGEEIKEALKSNEKFYSLVSVGKIASEKIWENYAKHLLSKE